MGTPESSPRSPSPAEEASSAVPGRRRLLRLAATFVVLFAACLATVLPDGGATRIDRDQIPADARVGTVLPRLGLEDPHHYLRTGYNVSRERGIPPDDTPYLVSDRGVLNGWPPGMVLYYAALFTVFGPEMPVGVVTGATMALLWALVLTAYVDLLVRYLHRASVALLVAVVLLTASVRDWFLGFGILWSEGLYTWCVLAALYAAMRSATARSDATRLGWAAGVGGLLGLSAYVRNISDLLGWFMLALLALWSGLTLARTLLRRWQAHRGRSPHPRRNWHRQLLALVVCAVAFQFVTMPWRIYAAQTIRPGNYAWSLGTTNLWHDSWTPDRMLLDRGFGWLAAGRPNTACVVDPDTCREIAAHELRQPDPYSGEGRYTERIYRNLTIRAALDHPIEYASDRLAHLRKAWFWTLEDRSPELVENGLLALAVVAALLLSVRRVWKWGPDLVALMFPGLALASMFPFVFFHYEARYFTTIKLVAVIAAVVLVALDPLTYRRSTMAWANSEHLTSVAPSMSRAKS